MQNTEKAGGTRFSAGKPGMWWGVPVWGLRLVAKVTQYGSRKYAPQDWKQGQSFSTLIDAATRHWFHVLHDGPWSVDEDYVDEDGNTQEGSGLYHAAHAAWNILTLLTFMALKRYDVDDVSGWEGMTTAEKRENGFALDNPPPSKKLQYPAETLADLDDVQIAPAHNPDMEWDPDAGSFMVRGGQDE